MLFEPKEHEECSIESQPINKNDFINKVICGDRIDVMKNA